MGTRADSGRWRPGAARTGAWRWPGTNGPLRFSTPSRCWAARSRIVLSSGPGSDLSAGGEAGLGEDAFDVALGGAWGDNQLGSALLVAQALGDQPGDLAFPTGQHALGARVGGRWARSG